MSGFAKTAKEIERCDKARRYWLYRTLVWRRGRDSNPCGVASKRFSRPPRYDHFDTSPCRIRLFCSFEKMKEKRERNFRIGGFEPGEIARHIRGSRGLDEILSGRFQDRSVAFGAAVMTASIPLRVCFLQAASAACRIILSHRARFVKQNRVARAHSFIYCYQSGDLPRGGAE